MSWSEANPAEWQVLDLAGADLSALTEARHWAEAQLAALGDREIIDAVIVVGELLDNAYQHAGGPRQLRIYHRATPCEVTVAVADSGAGEPQVRAPDRGGGRGLLLVDQLCSAWGVSRHDDGKLVWGRVDCEEVDDT
ncbi:ATP-binding protein [Amycolatopsis sp. CA-126428]|uniref:ATP-binding protein n=1 Tax=Amycolatopsis sp. CA-126428 TaxID=2073158 RepID=UPI001E504125|nr:ATP-binding protein [Amycolatopsis sp. CA-126428]